MSEVTNFALENLPYITSAAGAIIGAADGAIIHGKLAKERQAFVEHIGEDVEEQHTRISRNRFTSPIVGALAVGYAVAGFGVGMAFQEERTPTVTPPSVEYIVDRSGPTIVGEGANRAVVKIDNITKLLVRREDLKIEAVVAQGGDAKPVGLNEVTQTNPLGSAPMRKAFRNGISTLRIEKAQSDNPKAHEGAIIVATNGSSIGETDEVIKQANAPEADTPVYIVDVAKKTDGPVRESLEKIAEQTGGKYMDSFSENDLDALAKQLQPAESPANDNENWPLKALALVLAASGIALLRNLSRKLPLTYNRK